MITSRDRILTTHVGSLPRNERLSELLMAQEEGKDYDPKVLASEMDKAVRHVVTKQMEAGIDIGNDGEQRRISFQTYVPQRMTGFGGVSKRRRGREFEEFPELLSYLMRRFPNPAKSSTGRSGSAGRYQIQGPQADYRRNGRLQQDCRRSRSIFRTIHDGALTWHHFNHHAQCVLQIA